MPHDNVFGLTLCSFFPEINSIKTSNSIINKICNSSQLSKFATKFILNYFVSFSLALVLFYQYNQFAESIYVAICIA